MSTALQAAGQPRCVVVTRFTALGDVVLASGALEALRAAWPGTRIVMVVKEPFSAVVRHNPNIDVVMGMKAGEGTLELARRIREHAPDAMLDLHGRPRTLALAALLRPARRVRWVKRPWQDEIPVRMGWRPYRAQMFIAERYHRAVEQLVGRTLPRGHLRLWVSDEERAAARALLDAAGVDAGKPLVGMSPGANWDTKRWPVERFADLARRAMAAGAVVALSGSGPERALCAQVASAAPGVLDLAGKMDLGVLGGFIALCRAFVANDSGPMHMARALGVPTLAFFGSTDPEQFQWDGHARMWANEPCAPCSFYGLRTCPRGHFRCMNRLDADDAWRALEPMLVARGPLYVHA